MDRLEIHTLICKRDVELFTSTYKLFKHHSGLDFDVVVHEDGSFDDAAVTYITENIPNVTVIRRSHADYHIKEFLKDYELCTHFRYANHHTIFKIKLFDLFYFTKSNNILYLDADILFCKHPTALIEHINNRTGFYLRDMSSAYCVPFRDEDGDTTITRQINAGLNYYPTKNHYSLKYIEECLSILYDHGSRGATHPFLEQNCIAYMITKLGNFSELPHPDYCVPTFGQFLPEHGLTALHLNSSNLIGRWRNEHYEYELNKISPNNQ